MSRWFFVRSGDNHNSEPIQTMDQVSIYSKDWNSNTGEFTRADAVDYLTESGKNGGYIHDHTGAATQFVAPKPK